MYKDKHGAWMLRTYAGRDPLTGKKTWKARSFRGSKREAQRALAAFVTEQFSSRPAGPSRTFGELVERWFEARSGDWSPSTAQQTRWMIDGQLRGLSDRKVAALTVEDLDQFYAALRERGGRGGRPLAGSTVARLHGIVRLALGQAAALTGRTVTEFVPSTSIEHAHEVLDRADQIELSTQPTSAGLSPRSTCRLRRYRSW